MTPPSVSQLLQKFRSLPERLRKQLVFGVFSALSALTLAGLASVGLTFFAPELAEIKVRFELTRQGVSSRALPTLSALEKNHCADLRIPKRQDGTYDPASCSCILLIHGAGDSNLTWRKLLEVESNAWSTPPLLLALDLPGFGKSPLPAQSSELRVRAMALKIRQELKSVSECRRWMVVGNSFGGWVAAWMFLDESTAPTPGGAWLDRLVLVDSAGLRSSEDSRENSGAREWLRRGGVEALQEFQRRAYHSPRPLPASAWKAAAARLEASPTRKILEAQSPDERLDTFLPQIKRPTMVFWGASDRVTLPEAGRTFASLIPNARYQEAPSCGHLPQKECPKVLLKALNEHVMAGTL